MRTIEEYMKLPYQMNIIPDLQQGGYIISFAELPGCITYGDTLQEALDLVDDCKRSWFAGCINSHYEIPEPDIYNDYSGQFKLRIPKKLHKDLAINAKKEGISMNQYCLYLLSSNNAIYTLNKKHAG